MLRGSECMVANTTTTKTRMTRTLRYVLPLKGRVAVWFTAPVTLPGYNEDKVLWEIPISKLLSADQV